MSETPPPPPTGGDPNQPPPPTTPYPQQPAPEGWQPGWQESWQPTTGGPGAGQPPSGQPPYGQPPYGQPPNPQVPYGTAQFPAYGPIAPDHPQATTVLILGIVGIVVCGVAAPFAWVMGNRVIREIDASGGTLGGRSNANAGRICGIIGSVLIGLGLLVAVAAIIIAVASTASSA